MKPTRETSSLGDALRRVRERIGEACVRAGRASEDVTLVAVSKTVPADRVRALADLGHNVFGENRVQEAMAKISDVGGDVRWHLVGHLQRNKARHAVGSFELIHSVGKPELARELDRRAERAGIVQPILLQVNLSLEPTKHGAAESEVDRLMDAVLELSHLDTRGLMTIPPPVEDAEQNRAWFARLRELCSRQRERTGLPLPDLSMGMTDDYPVAVEEGATLVRVGRALFGERPG